MVSDTVIGATIGVSGAIIGSLLTGAFSWLTTQQKIQAANQRRRAEFVAERKVDKLIELANELQSARELIIHSRFRLRNANEIPLEELAEMPIKLQKKAIQWRCS